MSRTATFIWLAAVALVAALYIASLRPKVTPSANSCINNLRQLDGAKQQWALEYRKSTNEIPSWQDVAPFLGIRRLCPDGGTYRLGKVGDPPVCSIGGRRHTLPP